MEDIKIIDGTNVPCLDDTAPSITFSLPRPVAERLFRWTTNGWGPHVGTVYSLSDRDVEDIAMAMRAAGMGNE